MSIHYAIQHTTRFTYASTVSESQMEVRMQPRTEAQQTCLEFDLNVQPRSRAQVYRDFLGNWVHHFNVPRHHQELAITAHARVEVDPPQALPESLDPAMWGEIDTWTKRDDHWDLRHPSHFATWSDALVTYADALPTARSTDPLSTVRGVMAAIHRDFEYAPKSTRVDSPIDEALSARKGVCQDFTHIMLAVLRLVGLPGRYVSGYIAPRCPGNTHDLIASATHAWVEVLLPGLGWVGFDPTNNIEAGIRHVRVAVGRDYADVPPTRGVFKGDPSSTLEVSVEVKSADLPAAFEPTLVQSPAGAALTPSQTPLTPWDWRRQMQQQQQQ